MKNNDSEPVNNKKYLKAEKINKKAGFHCNIDCFSL